MSEEKSKVPARRVRLTEDYRRTFESASGRRVLQDLMDKHFMLRPTHDDDPGKQQKNEGQREVVLRILTLLKVDIAKLRQHMEEIQKDVY